MLTYDDEERLKAMEAQLGEVAEPTDVDDVTQLSKTELLRRFSKIRSSLFRLDEMVYPKTEEGRELHSQRAALLHEMSRRGMR